MTNNNFGGYSLLAIKFSSKLDGDGNTAIREVS